MKVKIKDLKRHALNYAVAKCEGQSVEVSYGKAVWAGSHNVDYNYEESCKDACPIFFREGISLLKVGINNWRATADYGNSSAPVFCDNDPLAAGLRCYVAKTYGDEIDIPDELFDPLWAE